MSKAILFDFDGVLVNTGLVWYEIHKANNPHLTYADFQALSNGNYIHAAEAANKNGKFNLIPDNQTNYEARLAEEKVEEVLADMIERMAADHKLFIVSSGSKATIENYLQSQNLHHHFMDVLGHEFHTSKEEKIKHILETHAVEPHLAVMISDTSGDIVEAKQAGVKTIGVLWGIHDGDMLAIVGPEKIVNTPAELEAAIAELLG